MGFASGEDPSSLVYIISAASGLQVRHSMKYGGGWRMSEAVAVDLPPQYHRHFQFLPLNDAKRALFHQISHQKGHSPSTCFMH